MSSRQTPDDLPTRRHPPIARRRPPAERVPQAGSVPPRTRSGRADRTVQVQPPPEPPDPGSSGLYVPWWGFALVILAVAGITCGLWGLVLMNRGESTTGLGPTPTPIFVVITATPTLGPASEEAGTSPEGTGEGEPMLTPTETAPPEPSPTPEEEERQPPQVGSTVIVTGTEGDGLNIRQGPGVNFTLVCLAQDGDQFLVEDGPREGDGYTWWSLSSPENPDCFGWAVEPFLEVILP